MLTLALLFLSTLGQDESLPCIAIALEAGAGSSDAPKILNLEPALSAPEVDAKKTTQLVITFDRPMQTTGWSLCGGGPQFPNIKGKPHWDTPTKLVVDVVLEPDHPYRLSLNCPAATNFKSAEGVPLVPVPWSFSTLPEKLSDQGKQRADNHKALDALKKILASNYSYYDLRVHAWDKLLHEHEAAILGMKTTRGWAGEVAKMLSATEDIHLHLKLGDQVFATGTRAIDPLYREALLAHYATIKRAGDACLQGRTKDGIGYVMIGAWEKPTDIDAIEDALAGLRDCKALIVDVRPNSGGDELLARRIAWWFVEGTKVYAKNRYRVHAGNDGFGPVQERSITGNEDPAKHIAVPIAVLTSNYVMSSNESFVLMMRQAKDCTVVGQRTFGSSGNPTPFELPNGVTIVVPSWQDLRLDGTCFEGEGLAPDVEVAATPEDFASADPILEKALALLRGKIKG